MDGFHTGQVLICHARDLLGEYFWPGMIMRVGDSSGPLFDGDSCTVRPGMLVKFSFPGRASRLSISLEARMRRPVDAFADVDEEGTPEYFSLPGSCCVLQCLMMPSLLTIRRHASPAEVSEAIGRGVAVPPAGYTVVAPRTRLYDVCIRGSGAERVLGVKPRRVHHMIGAFVDARDLAVSVKFVVLPQKVWSVSELAEAVGIYCRAPMKVTNSRGGQATSAQGRLSVLDTDVLTFSCLIHPDARDDSDFDAGGHSRHPAMSRNPSESTDEDQPCNRPTPRSTGLSGDVSSSAGCRHATREAHRVNTESACEMRLSPGACRPRDTASLSEPDGNAPVPAAAAPAGQLPSDSLHSFRERPCSPSTTPQGRHASEIDATARDCSGTVPLRGLISE